MEKCYTCNSTINKHFYHFEGNVYGSNCIKKILPDISFHPDSVEYYNNICNGFILGDNGVIDVDMYLSVKSQVKEANEQKEAERQQKYSEYEQKRKADHYATIEALKNKDFSKITNEFKINLSKDLIQQYEEKGYLSDKQRDMIHKWFSKKDKESYKNLYNKN